MSRSVRDSILDKRTARARLKPCSKPYYRAIDTGLHLGYRKGKTGGRWVMRWYVGNQDYRVETIGTADDIIDADGSAILNFWQAQGLARRLYLERKRSQAGLPSPSGPYTVETCLKDYIEWLEVHRKTGPDARYRANAFILPELGKIECSKLTAPQLQKWLENAANKPPRIRSKRGKAQRYRTAPMDDEGRRRRRATVNRTLTVLKAALNRAWADGRIPSDQAWRRVKPFKQADAARVRYFTIEEAKRLINASPKDFRLLVEAALATGARYSELAALNVEDFNPDSGTVHVRTSKSGRGRHVVLTDEGIALFASLAAGREGEEPMFLKASGERWATAHQTRPMAEACKAARITPAAGFHCLRHTYASHAIMNGAPLIVAAKNLGHADTRMVERHYGHLTPSYLADTIRATAPRFGIGEDHKIVAIRT